MQNRFWFLFDAFGVSSAQTALLLFARNTMPTVQRKHIGLDFDGNVHGDMMVFGRTRACVQFTTSLICFRFTHFTRNTNARPIHILICSASACVHM